MERWENFVLTPSEFLDSYCEIGYKKSRSPVGRMFALAILAGFLSHGLLGVHPALAVVVGIAVLFGLLLLHCTRPGFWLIGGGLSVVWGFIFATMAYEFSGKNMVWTYVVWVLGAILVFALHLRARYKIA